MIFQSMVLVFIGCLNVVLSLPVKEKITPVDLKHYCVQVTADDEKVPATIPVLLIHGVGGSHKEWDGFNLHLSFRTKRTVCSVDLRNHGDSPWSNNNGMKALVADIGRFLDKQGLQKVNLIGHSLGGKVAVHYTLNNPNRVNSLVVEDMRPNGMVKAVYNQIKVFFKLLKEAMSKVPLRVTEDKAREIIINFLNTKLDQLKITQKFTEESLSFLQLKQIDSKWSYKLNIDVILKSMEDLNVFLGKSTGVYKGPTLFIYGDKSPFKVGEDKTNILQLFPKAKMVPVEGADHIIHGKFPKFDEEVIKFLKEVN